MQHMQQIKHKLMAKSRENKYQEFIRLAALKNKDTILDVGAADEEYSPYDNYLEKRFLNHSQITALSLHDMDIFKSRYPDIGVVTYPGGKFPFKDKQFTAVHSNAVIEHVGDDDKQIEFIKELSRCGEKFYFSTPAKEFPFEIHTNYPFIHWLPKSFFDPIVKRLRKGWASGDYMYLLSKRRLRSLVQRAGIEKYVINTHKIGFFPYQYTVFGTS